MKPSAHPPSSEHAKKQIVTAFLAEAAFHGWNDESLKKSCKSLGYEYSYSRALFPAGASEIADYYLHQVNSEMRERLSKAHLPALKIRERIKQGVLIRLKITEADKAAIKSLLAFFSQPSHAPKAVRSLAALSDTIWRAAGDTSTDYNYYTKRLLLSGVYSSTLLFWLNDTSPNHAETETFLDRRINDVMQIEKVKKSGSDLVNIAEKKLRRFL